MKGRRNWPPKSDWGGGGVRYPYSLLEDEGSISDVVSATVVLFPWFRWCTTSVDGGG
ncbi:hypothetical protein HanOQP8_Chr09g0344391 [Helianthus annuus]|nr:hypothetical protein HanOQP8_Chr09g0344391 [Helianthus annuus]